MIKRLLKAQLFSRFILRNHVFSVKTKEKILAFTFDDGPDPVTTRAIVDLFSSYGGTGTFYFQGNHAEKHPETVLYAWKKGFSIGNHSYNHPKYTEVGILEMIRQIRKTNQILQSIIGSAITTIRPPANQISQLGALVVKLLFNQPIVNCNIAPTDWNGALDTQALAAFLIKSVQPGAIICLHDSSESTFNAMKLVLPVLHAQGYTFLSIDKMKAAGDFSPKRMLKVNNLTA